MYKYELTVFWSDEDKAFVVTVPELPGCLAHGDTPVEAVASAQEAIGLWIEAARAAAIHVPAAAGRSHVEFPELADRRSVAHRP